MSTRCDDVARLKKLEQLLDRQISVFGVRVGADGALGLVPVVGDLAAAALGLYVILEARRLGATQNAMVRMAGNWCVDLILGAVPLVGDVFDVLYRSNGRNVRLLIADLERRAGELREVNREQQQLRAA
jgi:hypothetical protein